MVEYESFARPFLKTYYVLASLINFKENNPLTPDILEKIRDFQSHRYSPFSLPKDNEARLSLWNETMESVQNFPFIDSLRAFLEYLPLNEQFLLTKNLFRVFCVFYPSKEIFDMLIITGLLQNSPDHFFIALGIQWIPFNSIEFVKLLWVLDPS